MLQAKGGFAFTAAVCQQGMMNKIVFRRFSDFSEVVTTDSLVLA